MNTKTMVFATAFFLSITRHSSGDGLPKPFQPIKRQERRVETVKHVFSVGDTGFPQQIFIKPDQRDLPLEMRTEGVELEPAALVAVGRGNRIRQPIRLIASAGGNNYEATAAQPARVTAESARTISYQAQLKAGAVAATLAANYQYDGIMTFDIKWKTEEPVESLYIVIDLLGAVTHAYRGLPGDFSPNSVDRKTLEVLLSTEIDTVVWTNKTPWLRLEDAAPDYLYFGSLDSGFTWLADDWSVVDNDQHTIQIRRNNEGDASFCLYLINAGVQAREGSHSFALITHPAKPKPQGYRLTQWLEWQQLDSVTLPLQPGMLGKIMDMRKNAPEDGYIANAINAAAIESTIQGIEMKEFAGAYSISPDKDNIRLYPASLFAVLSAPYTGVPVRLYSNMRELAASGETPTYDRQYLGRALLHDAGVAIAGLKQPYQYIRLVEALEDFGFFDSENIEVLPYWRNGDVIRYGEPWTGNDAFAVTAQNPAANCYVTAYRKHIEIDGKAGYAALVVIMNENDTPVRERLHILDTEGVFGGLNKMKATALAVVKWRSTTRTLGR